MKEERKKLEKELIKQVKKELNRKDYGEVWTLAIATDRKELKRQILQTHQLGKAEGRGKILVKMEEVNLVDGTEIRYQLKKQEGEIQLNLDTSYADLPVDYQMIFGTTVEDGLLWLGKKDNLIHLDLRDSNYSSYKKEINEE